MKRRIGLFGGTFDPVHLGHLHAAQVLLDELSLSEIFFIPAFQPVHRETPQASTEQRLAMLKMTIQQQANLQLDEREVVRGGASYALYTLEEYRNEYPDDELFFIVGTDAFNAIETWFEWQTLFTLANFIVLPRPGYGLEVQNESITQRISPDITQNESVESGKIILSKKAMLRLSATEVRSAIANNQDIDELLAENVANYVKDHNIYDKDLLK